MMNILTSKNITLTFSIIFTGVGILGFIPNPLVSDHGIFEVNAIHNLVHIATGIVFFTMKSTEKTALLSLKIVGVVYAAVSILGFLTGGDYLLGLVRINDPDRWLHVALAGVILASGFVLPHSQTRAGTS